MYIMQTSKYECKYPQQANNLLTINLTKLKLYKNRSKNFKKKTKNINFAVFFYQTLTENKYYMTYLIQLGNFLAIDNHNAQNLVNTITPLEVKGSV